MTEPKLTPWIPVALRPVRRGWYDYRIAGEKTVRLYWNGPEDGWGSFRNPVRLLGFVPFGTMRGDQWRGLAVEQLPWRPDWDTPETVAAKAKAAREVAKLALRGFFPL